jgi:hypothetical protein
MLNSFKLSKNKFTSGAYRLRHNILKQIGVFGIWNTSEFYDIEKYSYNEFDDTNYQTKFEVVFNLDSSQHEHYNQRFQLFNFVGIIGGLNWVLWTIG